MTTFHCIVLVTMFYCNNMIVQMEMSPLLGEKIARMTQLDSLQQTSLWVIHIRCFPSGLPFCLLLYSWWCVFIVSISEDITAYSRSLCYQYSNLKICKKKLLFFTGFFLHCIYAIYVPWCVPCISSQVDLSECKNVTVFLAPSVVSYILRKCL